MKPYLLELENFQSIREKTGIQISPLTFLYGPNSAGKSCVDDAFALLSSVFSATETNPHAMLKRWAHYAPSAIQEVRMQESVTYLTLHCQVGRIFSDLSATKSFENVIDFPDGLIGWFERTGWNIVLGLEGDPDGITALTLSAGTETVFRVNISDDGCDLQISRKAFGKTLKMLAAKHFVDFKRSQKVHKFACEVSWNPTLFLNVYKGEDINRDIVAIINAMLEDLKSSLVISPKNLGSDRSTIKNHSLSTICGGSAISGQFIPDSQLIVGLPSNFYYAPAFELEITNSPQFDFMKKLALSSYKTIFGDVNLLSLESDSKLNKIIGNYIEMFSDIRADSSEKLHDFVNRCLREHLFLDHGYQLVFEALEISPVTEIQVPRLSAALMIGSLIDVTGRRMTFEDVGTGISCVIPVLVALHSGNSFVQQPELHLHPALQSALGDVFAEATKVQNSYHFIETHSEYILLRCLRRVRETTAGQHPEGSPLALKPEDISVLYFDPQPDGCTKVKNIRVSSQGDFIDRWPRGFFEERGKELFDE